MKKLTSFFVVSMFSLLTLAGCKATPSTALGVTFVAYQAVASGNVAQLRSVLAEEALDRFGNAESLAQLQNEFRGVTLVSSRATVLGTSFSADGHIAQRTYSVEVLGKNGANQLERKMNAQVSCSYSYTFRPIHPRMTDGAFDYEITHSICKITQISL